MESVRTMRHLGLLLAGGLIVVPILLIGIFSFFPAEVPPQPAIVVPVDPTITHLENRLTEQEATYQARVTALDQALQQEQADFQAQVKKLNMQIVTAQEHLDSLKRQEQDLQEQTRQLEISRAERVGTYQTALRQTRDEYTARQTQLQAQLDEAQAKLTEVNAQLKR